MVTWDDNFSPTFSKGLVGSVYLLPVRSSLLTDVTVHTYYRGAHATAPLSDGEHAGFEARIRAHVTASSPLRGVLTVHGAWSSTPATRVVSLAPGAQVVTHNITVGAKEIQLWWPNGAGAHALYQVDVVGRPAVTRSRERRIAQPRAPRARRCADWHTYAAPPHAPPQTLDLLPAACAEGDTDRRAALPTARAPCVAERLRASRRVGFRSLAWVTGDESDAAFVARAADGEGSASPTFTTMLRVNGARGACPRAATRR